jgi:uncharacterized protein (DUF2141 family)
MKVTVLTLVMAIAVSIASPSEIKIETSSTGSIRVEITGLRNTAGQVAINIFAKKDGFPGDWQKAYRHIIIPIEGPTTVHTFTNIPYGKYSVSVMHDENKNEKLDTNFMGIPKEGYGVSNNITSSFGPPKFEDATFVLDQPVYSTTINVNY